MGEHMGMDGGLAWKGSSCVAVREVCCRSVGINHVTHANSKCSVPPLYHRCLAGCHTSVALHWAMGSAGVELAVQPRGSKFYSWFEHT